ncbi:MAG: ABC-type transport system involved in multi-copper enzyme maturation, permease component [halophilic archaeon J07HX5]|nr:MAG: ABC-type transport system involved in multi-copper enzyme maturation, permease component [halophilic archaeon J07HX5]
MSRQDQSADRPQPQSQPKIQSRSQYWLHVARKDFADAVRSGRLWSFLILFFAIALYLLFNVSGDEAIESFGSVMRLLLPVVAVMAGYMAIVGERETGSIRMMLSLPVKRSDVLIGKYLGRCAVVIFSVFLAFGLAALTAVLRYGGLPINAYGAFLLQAILVGAVFSAIAVGCSASVSSQRRAVSVVIGVILIFQLFWRDIVRELYGTFGGDIEGSTPTLVETADQLSPMTAIDTAVSGLNVISTSELPVFQEWVSAVIIMMWIVGPLTIGYLLFRNSDIS